MAYDDKASFFAGDSPSLDLEDRLYLEALATIETDPNPLIEHLSLSVAFEKPNSRDLYAKAVKKLKEAVPNVKDVKFNGGYVFDPLVDSPETFKQEAQNLKTHFDNLIDLFSEEKLPVNEVKFVTLMTFDRKTVNDANFVQIYGQLFGAKFDSQDVDLHRANFEYTKGGVKFEVECSLSITILRKENKGKDIRSPFYNHTVTAG